MTISSNPRGSWREKGNQQRHKRFTRIIRRLTVVLVLVVLAGSLLRFLLLPFLAPTTHLVFIGSGNHETMDVPPIPFVAEDQRELGAIDAAVVHDGNHAWRTASSASHLAQVLTQTGLGKPDRLLVYLTAQGISQDGHAYLLCDNFNLRRPDAGRVSVESLLEQVSASPAAVKVLFINAGRLDYDPRLGMVVNEFPRLLEQAVRNSEDPSLWVYCSHSSMQYSHVSRALGRSVFGLFVSEGLRGAADLNRDRSLDLNELSRFVSANVDRWVQHSSDRGAEQTPKLMWGGVGDLPATSPQLLTMRHDSAPREFNVSTFFDDVEDPASTASSAEIVQNKAQPSGVLLRRHVTLTAHPPSLSSAGLVHVNVTPPGVLARNQVDAALNPASLSSAAANAVSQPKVASGNETSEPADKSDSESQSADKPGELGSEQSVQQDLQPKPKPEQSPAPNDPGARSSQLLAQAWLLRDQSSQAWSATNPSVNPIEIMPHTWRELQGELLGFEQRLRSGKGNDPTSIQSILENSLSAQLPTSAKGQATVASLWDAPAIKPAGDFGVSSRNVHSLALAELIAQLEQEDFGIDVAALIAALNQDSRKDLDAWLTKNQREDVAAYYEIRYLKRLTAAPGLDWNLLQVAAQSCILGERVAALDWLSPDWIRPDVDRADQLRYFAEELIFDRIGPNWRKRLESNFAEAAGLYQSAEAAFYEVRRAEHGRNTIFDSAPYYLRMYRSTRGTPAGDRLRYEDLSGLLSLLAELTNLLDHPHTSSVAEVTRVREDLEQLHSRIGYFVGDSAAERLVERTATPSAAWQAEMYLETPLLSGSMRQRLLGAVPGLDRETTAAYQPAKISSLDTDMRMLVDSATHPSAQDWQLLVEQARLESKFVGLCQSKAAGRLDTVPSISDCQAVTDAMEALEKKHLAVLEAYGNHQEMPPAASESVNTLWRAYGRLGETLASFYRDVNVQPGVESQCDENPRRTAARFLRVLDARDAWRYRRIDLSSISAAARLRTTLQWQASRLEQASEYQSLGTSQPLLDLANAYRRQSADICQPTAKTEPSPQLTMIGPTVVDLQYTSTVDFSIEFHNPGTKAVLVDVAFDYDLDLIQFRPTDLTLNQGPIAPTLAAVHDVPDSYSGLRKRTAEPLLLAIGQRYRMGFQVLRRAGASQASKIVIDAYDASSSPAEADAVSQTDKSLGPKLTLLKRHKIDVVLPVGEVFVQQSSGETVSQQGKLRLTPFPNRIDQFKFGVVNRSSSEKQVTLGLYALTQPWKDISPDQYHDLVAGQTPLTEFKMTAAGNEVPAFPVAKDAAEPSSEATEGAKQEPADQPAPIKAIKLQHGLLAVLKDSETGQMTFRQIEFGVRRPRNFLQPRVGFNANSNRIEIDVSAIHPSLLPSGKPVSVSCRLAAPVPGGLQGKLQGLITSPDLNAKLFINMPALSPQVARLYIDVDDFPRAFIFDVPCGQHAENIPEVTGLLDVRMATASEQVFRAATNSITVAVEIDAPVGTFLDGDDLVELSVDLDGTGVPDPASAVHLKTDRSASMSFIKAMPDGTLSLESSVSDFQVELPSERLENVRIDVAARVTVKNEVHSIPSIPLYIDTAPPMVGPINPINFAGAVPALSQLELRAWAWDTGSGVKKVEAVFDILDSGQFPTEGEFIQATPQAASQWTFVIAAGEKPGPRTLLVRGVDWVGNPSDPQKVQVEVISPTENAARIAQKTIELAGTVWFRNELVPQAEITLVPFPKDPSGPASAAKALSTQTSIDGGFYIQGVALGNYVLTVKGVINNRVRRSEQEFIVTAESRPKVQLDISLP